MAFGITDLNTVMTGVNGFNAIKHQEDTKGMVQQTNIHSQINRNVEEKLKNVNSSENAENYQKKFDAKEKGSNSYSGDGGQKKKKPEDKKSEGKVVPKYTGFDMKI